MQIVLKTGLIEVIIGAKQTKNETEHRVRNKGEQVKMSLYSVMTSVGFVRQLLLS